MKLKIQLCVSFLLALFCFGLAAAHGAALTTERATGERRGQSYSLTVTSNVVIYSGAIVARSSAGTAVPASDASGDAVIGCAVYSADNRAALYHADRIILVKAGVFGWAHTGFTAADIGSLAYVLDDQTVTPATNATYDIVAGVIVGVDGDTCWVDTGNIPRQGAQSVASIAVSGSATVGTTLAVTGNGTVGGTLGVTGAATFTSTVGASGFKIGAVSGFSGAVTNVSTLSTNVIYYNGGIATNVTRNP